MRKGLHPLVMIALVAAVTLFGRVLPTWTLSLATIAASNALIALGIVVLARTGNVSFGQGLFFAAGGYGVALIANAWGLTDAVAQVIVGAACGGLLGLVIGPLIARYSGIFFGMLTLALSMVFYGALVKSTALGGSDGFNVGRPSLFGMSFTDPREADFMLYAVSVIVTGFAGIAATILFRSEFGLASLAVRENNLRVEYLGLSANRIISINFLIAAIFAGASGAFALMAQRHIDPQFAYWTTSGEFVFVAVLAGNQSVAAVFVASMALELVRSFSNLYLPNTWQLVLGVFLLGVILFLPRGIGSLWIRDRRKRRISAAARPHRRTRSRTVNPVLSVRRLEKRFGAVVAADALTLDIPAGQKISLIGANGAGKTTFVNMVTGYLKPDSGTILLDGIDIGRRSPRSVARLGISRSFQIPQLFVELTAAENLAVAISGIGTRMSLRAPAEAQGRRDKAVELLERFGLADLADRPISELAGGVRKLIDIAMALVRRPKLLLLDEPTSGVSAEEKFTTMDRVIHAVAPDAATIVFVEHDMEIVSRYADRVVAFYQGRILADGVPAEVLNNQEVRRYVTGGVR